MKSPVLLVSLIAALIIGTQAVRYLSEIKPKHLQVLPKISAFAPRIVGGKPALPHAVPFQVAVLNGVGFCGGSIIRDDAILTAAHCINMDSPTKVIVGAHHVFEDEPTQQTFKPTDIRIHEAWNSIIVVNDVAVIRLPEKIKLGRTARIVTLNTESASFVGKEATICYWGKYADNDTSLSPVLRCVKEKIISNEECQGFFGDLVTNTNICLNGSKGRGACRSPEPSGGPLFITRNNTPVQVGIVSFGGYKCEIGLPTVYAKVSEYIEWIQKQLE